MITILLIRRHRRTYHDKNITLNHDCTYPNPAYQDIRPENDYASISSNATIQLRDVPGDGNIVYDFLNPTFQDVEDKDKKPDYEVTVQLKK